MLRNVAPTLLVVAALATGIWFGRWLALRPAYEMISGFHRGVGTLADYVEPSERKEYSLPYHDPNEALARMDEFLWAPPLVPTPFVGHAPAPGRYANTTINEQQFRYPSELAVPKPDGVFRVFLTGGSTAWSIGAPDDARTIAGYLESILSRRFDGIRFQVVTAGSPAWSSTHERLWIIHRVAPLEPDLVIALSGANDGHWGVRGRDVFWMRSYPDEFYWHLLSFLYEHAERPFPDVVPVSNVRLPPPEVAKNLLANVDLVTHALSTGGGPPYLFALQPTLPVTEKVLSEREDANRRRRSDAYGPGTYEYLATCHAAIRDVLAKQSIPGFYFADLSAIFDALGPADEIFLDSYHFGDRGNEQVARALARAVRPLIGTRLERAERWRARGQRADSTAARGIHSPGSGW